MTHSVSRLRALEPPRFNPFAPSFRHDPYPAYRRLIEHGELVRSSFGFWVAARFEHVQAILRDRRFGHRYEHGMIERHGPEIFERRSAQTVRRWMLVLNPPDHARVRGVLVHAFGPRALRESAPKVHAVVDELIDGLAGRGRVDLMRDYAYPLPARIICDLLGVPAAERAQFVADACIPARLIDVAPLSDLERTRVDAELERLIGYFERLCELRRHEPAADLTTLLVQAQQADGAVSSAEVVANMVLLFGAGQETTAHMIGNALLALHRNPDQLELLRAGQVTAADSVDELMRYDSSVQVVIRHALGNVSLAGVEIAKGERVMALLGAANRDPAIYPQPDRLDLTRRGAKPLAFGSGLHHCLGAQLARLEIASALERLLVRLPALKLEVGERPSYRRSLTVRGLEQLWAHF